MRKTTPFRKWSLPTVVVGAIAGTLACSGDDIGSGGVPTLDAPSSSTVASGSTTTTGTTTATGAVVTPGGATTTTATGDTTTPTTDGTATADPTTMAGDTSATADTEPTTPTEEIDVTSDPSLNDPLPTESAGPLVLRRLNPQEYSNTLADLLSDTANAGDDLPDEGTVESGFEVVESASTVSVQVFMETAERVTREGNLDVSCGFGGQEQQCASDFIEDFGRRAFRRPVKASELENLLALFDEARGLGFSVEESLQNVAAAMLQSSGFLYLWEIDDTPLAAEGDLVPLTQHQLASRLSYLIWGSMPDEQLSQAADDGALSTPDEIRAQAERLFANTDRARSTMRDFHVQWLHILNVDDLVKDQTLFPAFTDGVRESLIPELENFVSSVLLEGEGTSRELLTASHTFANADLAAVYGATAAGPGMSEISLDPSQRAGILTQTAFLATNANITGSNPPRRGKVLWEHLLCGGMPPVPADVPPVGPPAQDLTTRQRFEVHSENPCATGCHGVLDPLGFAFENYDAIGGYRATENGLPVDATGSFVTPAGGTIEFDNAIELMQQLAESYEVDHCIATNWARFILNRREVDADLGSLEAAYRASGAGPTTDFSIRDFITEFVQSTAFRYRSPSAGETL